MFQEIKRLTQDEGNLITRLFSLGGEWFVEQFNVEWKSVEKDIAFSLEEAEAMFAEWTAAE